MMFVTTTDEKQVAAERIGLELELVEPVHPGLRIFDAGMGDASLLSALLRRMHSIFPHIPWLVVGKEISLEDVRQALSKMPDRFIEHPELVWVVTNLRFQDAVQLRSATDILWRSVPLEGSTSHDFAEQARDLLPTLAEDWAVSTSKVTGNPIYRRPTALVLYRSDRQFIVDGLIPGPGRTIEGFDLIIASQAYRSATPIERKVQMVLAPLARGLAPGGRLVGIHARGGDPGEEIVKRLWPDFEPFPHNRHQLADEFRRQLGDRPDLVFEASAGSAALLRYRLHAMPSESEEHIGTSTVLAAWNAAAYVAQLDEERMTFALRDQRYAEASRSVMERHGEIWFEDEVYVISRST